MKKSVQIGLLAICFAGLGPSLPSNALAQDDPGAEAEAEAGAEAAEAKRAKKDEEEDLSDRIKAVQRKVFLKKQRVELFPYFGFDLNDPFFTHLVLGGSLSYHLVDSLSIDARGGFVFASIEKNIVRIIRTEAGAILENPPEFQFHADLDLTWAPIYGKISLFGDAILHFDTYVSGGPGLFGTDEGVNPAFNVGIGQRYFINKWLTFRAELRNYMFIEDRNNASSLQNLMVVGLFASIFLPTSFEYEFQ